MPRDGPYLKPLSLKKELRKLYDRLRHILGTAFLQDVRTLIAHPMSKNLFLSVHRYNFVLPYLENGGRGKGGCRAFCVKKALPDVFRFETEFGFYLWSFWEPLFHFQPDLLYNLSPIVEKVLCKAKAVKMAPLASICSCGFNGTPITAIPNFLLFVGRTTFQIGRAKRRSPDSFVM